MLLNSFKDGVEYVMDNPFGWPNKWIIENYEAVFSEYNILGMFVNSILLSLGETVVSMAMTCCAAYVLAKYRFPGSKFIYSVILISTVLPTIGAFPATYQLMYSDLFGIKGLTLGGTYFGMICLQCGAFGGSFLYIHSYFKSIPWAFAESARMDGASDFRIFYQIMTPLARNGILTFTIIRFLGFWNDYWMPSVFYNNHPTLAVGLAEMSATNDPTMLTTIYAGMVVSVIPVLLFYAIFQKRLMTNTLGGGLKE